MKLREERMKKAEEYEKQNGANLNLNVKLFFHFKTNFSIEQFEISIQFDSHIF
jgi:hypothetical protein